MNFDSVVYSNYKKTCTFRLSPIHVAYVNTFRRLIMTGVESVAFRADMTNKGTTTDVKVFVNDTPMTNEMLAHRIGLLPIHIKEPLKWQSIGDAYTFTLKVAANRDSIRDVTCSDFVITRDLGEGREPEVVPTAQFFPPHPKTRNTSLIATLAPGTSKIDLVAKATVGTGRENARFQPTSQCSYVYTRDEDPEKVDAFFAKWLMDAKKVNVGVLEKEDPAKLKTLRTEFNTMEIARVYLRDERGEPYSYDMTVESIGVLDVPYIVQRACEVGEAMVGKYANLDSPTQALPEDMVVIQTKSRIIGFDFLIRNHDHTLGNLLQTWLSEKHMDVAEGSGLTKITYAGYEIPHPLRDEMVLRIGVESGKKGDALAAFAQACRGCAGMFRALKQAWGKANPSLNAGDATRNASPASNLVSPASNTSSAATSVETASNSSAATSVETASNSSSAASNSSSAASNSSSASNTSQPVRGKIIRKTVAPVLRS
jgi:DNA-directed RNA polymerase subunit L